MMSRIPDELRYKSPESLVVGIGAYSAALASIMGSVAMAFDQIHDGPEPDIGGGYPRVLDNLKRVFFVVSDDMSAAEALRCHQAIWNWVEKLSCAGDQHDLVFIFILPATASKEYEDALAVGLCVPEIVPATTGHAVWRSSGTLLGLLDLVTATRPMDLLPLMARRTVDAKRLALARLRVVIMQNDYAVIREAAQAVLDAFHSAEYHLDLFCRPPSHRHGNLLREWLHADVTGPVTHDWCATGRNQIADWLIGDYK